MYEEASSSELMGDFPNYHIPYGIDTTVFKPYERAFVRDVFNLPPDKKILLFVSDSLKNERKGFELLKQALSEIYNDKFWLCAVGNNDVDTGHLENSCNFGRINDERLIALLYSACDAFVLPSREDNFPNVLLEATACGTPVIAFPIGGVPDIIEDGKNGLIAKNVSSVALAEAISSLDIHQFDSQSISGKTTKDYNLKVQAAKYEELYRKLLG
jgi:glycosyltransferase involved in cell wall biosynthesis